MDKRMVGVLLRLGRCLPRQWHRCLKRKILLRWPSLYVRDSVQYEQSLTSEEVNVLISKLDRTLELPGDIIECGCFLCGTTVHMARRVQERRSNKRIYACDTFEGFDPAEISREKRSGDASDCRDYTDSDARYVRRKLERLGVADQVVLVRGLFQDTLESLAGPFCFAFIDCDLHDSMLYAARTVWSRLSPGGCCLFDDYGNDHFRGATRAIDTFIAEQLSSICEHGCLSGKMYFAVKADQDTS